MVFLWLWPGIPRSSLLLWPFGNDSPYKLHHSSDRYRTWGHWSSTPWHPCLQNRGLANMWQGWGFTSSLATLSLWDLVCLKLQYQTRKHEMIPHFAQFKKSFITANLRCSVKKTVGEFIHIPIYSKTQGNQTGQGESRSTRSNLSFCSC